MSRFGRNAISSYGVRGLVGVSTLVLTPYLYRTLEAEGFGTWSVMFTFATVALLFQAGLSGGVAKLVAQHRGAGEHDALAATVVAGVSMYALAGVPLAALLAVIGLTAGGMAAATERAAFQDGMLILAVATLVRFSFVGYGAALQGYQRFDLYNLSWAVTAIGFAAGAIAAVELGGGVRGVSVAYGASLIVGAGLYPVLLKGIAPELRLWPVLRQRSRMGVARFSSFTLLAESMGFIGQRMDVVVIAGVRNAASAAPYAAAIKLQTLVQSLILPFVELLIPMISELWAQGRKPEVQRRFTLATRVALQLSLPFGVAFALFSRDIVDLWLGPVAADVTADIVVVLMAAQVALLTSAPAEKVLVGVGKVRVVGTLALIEGGLNIALSIVLVMSYGAIGAAIGTLTTSALLAPIKLPLACRHTGTSLRAMARNALGGGLLSSAPGIMAMLAIWLAMPAGAVRLATGLTVGLGLAAAVPLVTVGPRELLATLRGSRAVAQSPLAEAQS